MIMKKEIKMKNLKNLKERKRRMKNYQMQWKKFLMEVNFQFIQMIQIKKKKKSWLRDDDEIADLMDVKSMKGITSSDPFKKNKRSRDEDIGSDLDDEVVEFDENGRMIIVDEDSPKILSKSDSYVPTIEEVIRERDQEFEKRASKRRSITKDNLKDEMEEEMKEEEEEEKKQKPKYINSSYINKQKEKEKKRKNSSSKDS